MPRAALLCALLIPRAMAPSDLRLLGGHAGLGRLGLAGLLAAHQLLLQRLLARQALPGQHDAQQHGGTLPTLLLLACPTAAQLLVELQGTACAA